MPVIETDFAAGGTQRKGLFDELVAELNAPQSSGQPVVEIRKMSRDGLRHVHVIWDKWDGCPPERRASIIRDAFIAAKGAEYEKSIAITIAATVPEAQDAGLLPFEVKPSRRSTYDLTARHKAYQVLLDEGASPLGTAWHPLLAFANPEQAEDAVRRLKIAAPEFEWGVVEIRPSLN